MASKDYWIDLEELSQLGRELAEENLDPDLQGVDIRAFERLQPDEQVSVDNKDRPTENEIDIKKIGSKLAEIKEITKNELIKTTTNNFNRLFFR